MKKERKDKREPVVAPGFEDESKGEDATREDVKAGRYTRITRFEPRRDRRR